MIIFKKLLFAVPFLVCFYLIFSFSLPFFESTDYLFSLSMSALMSLIFLSLAIFLASVFFVVFATLADDWVYVAPVSLLAAFTLVFMPLPNILIYIGLGFIILLLVFWSLSSELKTYFSFQPGLILGPSVSALVKLLVLLVTLAYFLTVGGVVKQKGFNVPDSILNLAGSFAPSLQDQTASPTNLPNLTPDQISLLKQHPDLLKQYGIDPSILDQLSQPSNTTSGQNSTVQDLVKTQFQEMIKPYLPYMPGILTALFFVTVYSTVGLALFLVGPILNLIFWILKEAGFVHFQTEMREVKKLVV